MIPKIQNVIEGHPVKKEGMKNIKLMMA